MLTLHNYKIKNPFFLAPMAGVTDKPFRSFMREMSCGIITSELISVKAIQERNQKTRKIVEFHQDQRPFGVQIFGEDPASIGEGAKWVEDFGADFIDLNLGCPVQKIVKKGAGSALLKDLKTLAKVLHALKSSVTIPVSLKVRTGWDSTTRNADQVAHMAYEEGFSWMSIHGRTRAQAYSGQADWNYIKQIKSKSSIPIIGNGDLTSGSRAFEALQFSNCDAVMLGRGCLNDPWIFLEALHQFENFNSQKSSHSKTQTMYKKNFKIAIDKLKIHLENFYDERLFLLQLKKFAAWFSAGFPNSTEFRKMIFQEKDKQALIQKIDDFFCLMQDCQKPDPVYEPFLMQGHG